MTELEQLFNEFEQRIRYEDRLTKQGKAILNRDGYFRNVNKQYYVTIRDTDSSADNTSVEHSINQEQMMAQIEDMAFHLANKVAKPKITSIETGFEHFQQELKDCFAMHFKINSKPSNNSDEQLHSDEELRSKIESIAVRLTNRCIKDEVFYRKIKETYAFVDFKQELKFLFQTHRNTISTAVKQQNDNLVDEDELMSKIESVIYQSDYFDWSVTEPDVKRLLELFKTYQNSVLRPVNNSDEQSIIK